MIAIHAICARNLRPSKYVLTMSLRDAVRLAAEKQGNKMISIDVNLLLEAAERQNAAKTKSLRGLSLPQAVALAALIDTGGDRTNVQRDKLMRSCSQINRWGSLPHNVFRDTLDTLVAMGVVGTDSQRSVFHLLMDPAELAAIVSERPEFPDDLKVLFNKG